jgi:hypothetical protein
MGGEERFVKAIDFGEQGELKKVGSTKAKAKVSPLKRVK